MSDYNIYGKSIALTAGVLVMAFLITVIALAWTEPTLNPPEGNVAAPINQGDTNQFKIGKLGIATDGIDENYGLTVGSAANPFGVKTSGDSYFEGDLDMSLHKITNIAVPTNNNDAATKGYVDEQIALYCGSGGPTEWIWGKRRDTEVWEKITAYSYTNGLNHLCDASGDCYYVDDSIWRDDFSGKGFFKELVYRNDAPHIVGNNVYINEPKVDGYRLPLFGESTSNYYCDGCQDKESAVFVNFVEGSFSSLCTEMQICSPSCCGCRTIGSSTERMENIACGDASAYFFTDLQKSVEQP